jgi:hypothetical protein
MSTRAQRCLCPAGPPWCPASGRSETRLAETDHPTGAKVLGRAVPTPRGRQAAPHTPERAAPGDLRWDASLLPVGSRISESHKSPLGFGCDRPMRILPRRRRASDISRDIGWQREANRGYSTKVGATAPRSQRLECERLGSNRLDFRVIVPLRWRNPTLSATLARWRTGVHAVFGWHQVGAGRHARCSVVATNIGARCERNMKRVPAPDARLNELLTDDEA